MKVRNFYKLMNSIQDIGRSLLPRLSTILVTEGLSINESLLDSWIKVKNDYKMVYRALKVKHPKKQAQVT